MNEWRKHANCNDGTGFNPVFYNVRRRDEAKAICADCTVRAQCLDFAQREVDLGQADKIVSGLGVWGGLDGPERVRIRKGK